MPPCHFSLMPFYDIDACRYLLRSLMLLRFLSLDAATLSLMLLMPYAVFRYIAIAYFRPLFH